jgi:hypothetical protein
MKRQQKRRVVFTRIRYVEPALDEQCTLLNAMGNIILAPMLPSFLKNSLRGTPRSADLVAGRASCDRAKAVARCLGTRCTYPGRTMNIVLNRRQNMDRRAPGSQKNHFWE